MHKTKVAVIGSGFAGLASAALLAREGYDVTIYEKNDQPGGRARIWQKDGYTFDMGPSWYWMPEVFEDYFNLFGISVEDFYELKRLDPSYRVYWGRQDFTDVPAEMQSLKLLFESMEKGAGDKLDAFLQQAEYKYKKGMQEYVHKPSHSLTEYMSLKLLIESFKIQMFSSVGSHIRSFFSDPRIIQILEFPVLFLGGTAKNTPALYSMMNYADLSLGTWYPMGGMNKIVAAMTQIAQEQGVRFQLNCTVEKIETEGNKARGISTSSGFYPADIIISNADYEHTDQKLLRTEASNYSPDYWNKRTMSPSSLLFYIGLNKKVEGIKHHNLFFDEDFELHAKEIYENPKWPDKPLFYVSCPSKTDSSVAPPEGENLFFLIPIAPGLEDNEEIRERYFEILLKRFTQLTGNDIKDSIVVKRSYAVNDFIADYNSYKGNAYGLANTLLQTAFLKPKLRSKKISNLLYTGQLTVPGPGVPPAIISGQIAAKEATKLIKGS